MNKEEILAMEAGKELDAIIAEEIMGWRDIRSMANTSNNFTSMQGFPPDEYSRKKIPSYSTNISSAFEVVEKMAKDGWMLYKLAHTLSGMGKVDGCICIFLNIKSGASREAFANTAPESICEAALLTCLDLTE